jgi:MYXO-CTERM domain-containing protein
VVDALGNFTSSAGSLVITLFNLEANPTDIAQAISDVSFTVGNGSLTGATLSSSSGQAITIASNGTFTLGESAATGWVFGTSGGGADGSLDVLGAGGVGPTHLIIGPPGTGGTYSNANGSIAGNGPHNPFLDQSATFTITGSGITANTTITAATFSFGTTANDQANTVVGVPHSFVPEPSSLVLSVSGLGLLGLVGICRSRRRRHKIVA